jgi:hypothetical protein
MGFTENQKYVIYGIMKIFEANINIDTAMKIGWALWQIFNEAWSIVIYAHGSYETEIGYGGYIDYDGKWFVYGVRVTTNHGYTIEALKEFLKSRFGFAKIVDASAFQSAVESQVNERFPGTWKVHLVKSKPGFDSYGWFYGTCFDHDGYRLWVMPID